MNGTVLVNCELGTVQLHLYKTRTDTEKSESSDC